MLNNIELKYNKYYIEFLNIDKEIITWLENIIYENNSIIEHKEWKSKYNSYVVYDYEPFCVDGFEVNMVISSINSTYLDFIKYLYNNKLNTIKYLNNCVGV